MRTCPGVPNSVHWLTRVSTNFSIHNNHVALFVFMRVYFFFQTWQGATKKLCLQIIAYRQLIRARRALLQIKDVLLRTRRALLQINYVSLRTKRALLQIKDVSLRTRRALLPLTLYSDSTLLVLNGTSLSCNNALLALNWRYMLNKHYLLWMVCEWMVWGAVVAQWIRPRTLNCEVPGSNLLAAAVVPLGKTHYPHCLGPRKGLKAVGPLVACL